MNEMQQGRKNTRHTRRRGKDEGKMEEWKTKDGKGRSGRKLEYLWMEEEEMDENKRQVRVKGRHKEEKKGRDKA